MSHASVERFSWSPGKCSTGWCVLTCLTLLAITQPAVTVVLDSRKTTTPAHFELKPGLTPTVYLKHRCEFTYIKGWYDVYVEAHNPKVTSYASNTYCIIEFMVTRLHGINITFEHFDLEPRNVTTGECEDYVTIIDAAGRKASTPRYCGNKTPPNFVVQHNHAAILFVTDGDEERYPGFRMYLERIRLPSMDPEKYQGVKNIYGDLHTMDVVSRPPRYSTASVSTSDLLSLVVFAWLVTWFQSVS